jgi:AraC-like DNA-binding protein
MVLVSSASYRDAERYQSAFVGSKVEVLPTARGSFVAHAFRVELGRLWVTGSEESGSRIRHIDQSPDRAFITFLTGDGPEVRAAGMVMPTEGLIRHPAGHNYHECTAGPTKWGDVSLPLGEMALAGAAAFETNLMPPAGPLTVLANAQDMDHLRHVHAAIGTLARRAPDVIACPEVRCRLGQALLECLLTCCAGGEQLAERWVDQCHGIVVRRFRRLLEESADRALYIPEVCAAIGVPERTLRLCCQEHLGTSPKQFLVLRRMHLAQRTLLAATAAETSVTEVATRFGFWHFGRFAGGPITPFLASLPLQPYTHRLQFTKSLL